MPGTLSATADSVGAWSAPAVVVLGSEAADYQDRTKLEAS